MKRDEFPILVVDDDYIAMDVVVSFLQKEGFPVDTASSARDAIEKLKKTHYEMVIVDLKMPDANGIEVLKEALKTNPDMAVVIVTAYGTLENALEAIKLGAYDYITKPFKLQELLIVTENARQRASLIKENQQLKESVLSMYRCVEETEKMAEKSPEGIVQHLEKLSNLKDMGLLTERELKLLKDRLIGRGRDVQSVSGR